MSALHSADARNEVANSRNFSLSFGSQASEFHSESGASPQMDVIQNYAASAFLSSEVSSSPPSNATATTTTSKTPATSGSKADQKPPQPVGSDVALSMAAQTATRASQISKKASKNSTRTPPASNATVTNINSCTSVPPPPTTTVATSDAVAAAAAAVAAAAAEANQARNQNVRRNVYISGVPPTYRSEDFRQLCQQFGRVEAAKLCVDNRIAPTKAYGFALYYSEESAAACIRGLNGSFLQGRCVQARIADSHATPQPLGEAGAAINTTLPLPAMQRDRRENNAVGRSRRSAGSDGSSRGSQGRPTSGNSYPAGVPLLNGMSAPPMSVPFDPVTMAATTMANGIGGGAVPASMAQFYPFVTTTTAATAGGGTAAPHKIVTPGSSPADPHLGHNTSPSTAFYTVSPGSGSPCTDQGFGAIGTPMQGPLASCSGGSVQHAHGRAAGGSLSPASMALSPPLLSSHSTDSGSSLGSPTATTMMNTDGGARAIVGSHVNVPETVSPFTYSFSQMAPMMPAAMMGAHSGTGAPFEWTAAPAPGATTYMYYPLPTGGFGAFATAMPTAAPAHMFPSASSSPPPSVSMGPSANVLGPTTPFMYFPMGGMPMGNAMMSMDPTLPPYMATSSEGGFNGVLPPNAVVMDDALAMQMQMMHWNEKGVSQ